MDKNEGIYTIGYGSRSFENFLKLLQEYGIEYLIDVRTRPYSKFKPEYSQNSLNALLKKYNIRYVFMGDMLGGLPSDTSCYTDGKADYSKIAEKDFFQHGIMRLQNAVDKQCSVCLMCSEQKPHECHRSKLIGQNLHKKNIDILHIDEFGKIKSQEQVIRALLPPTEDLFGDTEKISFSRKKYKNNNNNNNFPTNIYEH